MEFCVCGGGGGGRNFKQYFKMLFNNATFCLSGFYKRESGFIGQKILETKE
jgi:hypothetical protein